MAKRHGKDTYFALATHADPDATGLVDISAYLNDVGFPRPIDTADASTFGATYKEYVVGLADSSISLSGRWDSTIDAQLDALVGDENDGTGIAYIYGPEGPVTGRVKYSGFLMLTSYDITGSIGDLVNFSCNCQGIGAVSRGTLAGTEPGVS